MSNNGSKLILTIRSIDFIDSLIINQMDSSSIICKTGELNSVIMIEKQVLQLKFNYCELDIDLSIIDLVGIRDETGNVLIKSEK